MVTLEGKRSKHPKVAAIMGWIFINAETFSQRLFKTPFTSHFTFRPTSGKYQVLTKPE